MMPKNVLGIVYSNSYDSCLKDFTQRRTMGSMLYGARYRLIDFALSNMVNSGINKVGIVTHNNYRSLMDHIGNGKDWDLARRSGGIMILPPFVTAYENPRANQLYTTRLEALMGATDYISHCQEDVIVLSDSDVVCNIDLSEVIEQHERTGADLTVVTKKMNLCGEKESLGKIIVNSENGVITEFVEHTQLMCGEYDVSTNILVFTKAYLATLIDTAIAHGYKEFYQQALPAVVTKSETARKRTTSQLYVAKFVYGFIQRNAVFQFLPREGRQAYQQRAENEYVFYDFHFISFTIFAKIFKKFATFALF
jgi:glucose-1-phosphate adenylyltransferase